MADTIEIRWHGRGGQGTVTAAKVLADACLSGGRHVQAFPEYGPERAGAPLREQAIFVVNTSKDPKEIRGKLNAGPAQRVFAVDATKIALECIGRALPNATMLGAICKVTGLVSLEHLLEDVKKSFGKKFSQKIIDGNLEATRRGYEEVKEG
jgi:pyruvate ferredoxin oxidoreductase gamma subunit